MRFISPPTIAPPLARYCHGVEVPPGWRILRSSGQLGLRPDGSVPATAREQADQCFANLAAILAEAGMGPEHVCHISAWLVDRADLAAYMACRDAFLAGHDVVPASTLLLVAGFSRPEFKVEVEVMAALP